MTHKAISTTVSEICANQKGFFASGKTWDVGFRKEQLRRLYNVLEKYEPQIVRAIRSDLGRAEFEASLAEVTTLQSEIRHTLRNISTWARVQKGWGGLAVWPGRSELRPEPLGQVLILSPWNYPFQLALAPWIAALSAGNVAVIKPSEFSPASSQLLFDLLTDHFDAGLVKVVLGDAHVAQELAQRSWGHVFFTGSPRVGREVMRAAAEHLTPVTLELGGKSPALVERGCDLGVAARRIGWGKWVNAGQTCLAPDHVWVEDSIADELIAKLKETAVAFYGKDPKRSPHFARIISDQHFHRLTRYLSDGEVISGGEHDPSSRYLAPTLIANVEAQSALDREEIFGPILPIYRCSNLRQAIDELASRPPPLAAYLFNSEPQLERYLHQTLRFGGGCRNDTMAHWAAHGLPFGGIGSSGMGRYHGHHGFLTFSHLKGWLRQSTLFDMPLRYPPYSSKKLSWLRSVLKSS